MLWKCFSIYASVFLFLQNIVCISNAANILGLLAMTSPSIQIWNGVLLHHLGELGHNVTILSVDLPKVGTKLKNVHYIHLEKAYAMYDEDNTDAKLDLMAYIGLSPFESIAPFYDFGVETCKGIVASKGFQTLLNYPDDFKFDLILNDYTLGPYMLGFLHKFKYPPLVGLTAFHNSPLTIDAMFNHYFPAYVPYHSTTFSPEMNFWERLQNTLLFIADTLYRRLVYLPQIDAIMRPHYAKDTPYLGELSAHTALSFVNSHPAIDYAEPLPPNVIEVGGMQIQDAKPLPNDLDDYMNASKGGVVLVSFGTNMKSEDFSQEQIKVILGAMSQLPNYNFMWKFDENYMKQKLPSNVLLRSFFPQRDILVHAANILGLLGVTSPSIQIWNGVLLHRLAELGHNVTILSVDIPDPEEILPQNVHYIHLEKAYEVYRANINLTAYRGLSAFEMIVPFYDLSVETCNGIVVSEGMQTLLNYPDDFKFDVIINDYTSGPYLLGFVHKFRYPPLVGLTAYHNSPLTIDAMFNHYFPAYVPYHSTTYSVDMNFWERLENTLIFIADTVYRRLVFLPKIDEIMGTCFGKDTPSFSELSGHTSISLVNSDPSIDYAEPLPPNVIEVGGMQIISVRPLPKDLEEFMNASPKGVILVSFGTNIKSKDFGDDNVKVVLGVMSQLPEYNFLWKFDKKYLHQKLPDNVLLRTFFPQRDILAHPKIKAFVTHCGGMSSQEATWRGVPMVGVPLFLDQHRNLKQSVLAGVAIKVDFLTMTTEILRDAIKRAAEDPKIRENVRIRSVQFRDQPMRPLDRAVWWVEYLLRNPNPTHLKSPAAKLNIFQANSLDVLLFLWTVLVVCVYLVFKILLLAIRKITKSAKPGNNSIKVKSS